MTRPFVPAGRQSSSDPQLVSIKPRSCGRIGSIRARHYCCTYARPNMEKGCAYAQVRDFTSELTEASDSLGLAPHRR